MFLINVMHISIIRCVTFLSLVLHVFSYSNYDPLLVAVTMVKNEETVIQATLQPFVDGGVNAFFVFDTGSTDNTIAQTEDFFAKNNILLGYIRQEPFIDFSTSRNRALELAQQQFPNAAFMIMLDAEWYLNDARGLIDFCQLCLDNNILYPAFHIRILNEALDIYAPRLIRCNCNVRFEGIVHESIYCQKEMNVPKNIYFEYLPTSNGFEKTEKRFIRDRELLYKEYMKNPLGTRNLFYLARTCEDLGNLEEAYHLYKKRIALIGWDEENFISLYRLAQTVEKLSYINEHYTWHEALDYYLQAYKMRPHRAEPLISIAYHYINQDDMNTAFLFARQAVEIAYPHNDQLFVEKYAYNYLRYELLARCAWYINKFEIGELAAQKAFDAYPDCQVAYNNLQWYLNRKHATTEEQN